jgi:predicted transcriptional regulator
MVEPVKPAPLDENDAAFVDAVKRGIAAADAGQTVSYEEVRRWLLSWGSESESTPPKCP